MIRRNLMAMVAFVLVSCALPFASIAQEKQEPGDELPSVEEVFDRYVEELGGAMVLSGVESARLSMKYEMPGLDETEMDLVWLSEVGWTSFAHIGGVQQQSGVWNERAWHARPEAAWASAAEAGRIKFLSPVLIPAHAVAWLEYAAESKVTGKQELEGTTVYVVEMDLEGIGKPKLFFGVESGLLFAVQVNQSGNGQMSDFFLKDHREVEGILVPHSIDYRIKDMDIEIQMTIEGIEFNGDVDESDLEVPEELKGEADAEDK